MAKFCGKCGSALDVSTGLCPNCDREKLNPVVDKKSSDNKTPKKHRSAGLSAVVTVLLSICLFVTSFSALLIYQVRSTVKEENIEKLLDKAGVTDLVYGTRLMAEGGLDSFYNGLRKNFGMDADDRSLDNFVDDSTVKEFVAEKAADFCEDFFGDDAELVIEKSEVVKLIRNNLSVIRDEFGVKPDDEGIFTIADWIFDGDKLVVIDSAEIKGNSPVLYYLLTIGLSYGAMIVFIILNLLIIFFMIRNSFSQAVCGTGIIFTLIGGVTGLIAMLSAWITPLWEALWSGSVIGVILGGFMEINSGLSIILFVVGIVMLIIRGIANKLRKK